MCTKLLAHWYDVYKQSKKKWLNWKDKTTMNTLKKLIKNSNEWICEKWKREEKLNEGEHWRDGEWPAWIEGVREWEEKE